MGALDRATGLPFGQSVEPLAELARAVSLAPANARMRLLEQYPEVLGSAATDDYLDLYFGTKKLNLLRLSRNSSFSRLYAEADAAACYRQYCATALRQHSSPDYNLVGVAYRNNGLRLSSSQAPIDLTGPQVQAVLAGQALPPDHPLSVQLQAGKPFIVWSAPLMQRATGPLTDVEHFCFGLQRAYPAATIVRDDFDPGTTPQRARQLAQLSPTSPAQLYVVLDASGRVEDYQVNGNLRQEMLDAGVNVISYVPGTSWQNGEGKGIIVVTGNADERLAAYVQQLGEAGFFRNNFVLLNSCQTPVSTQLVADINSQYGAIATHRLEGLVPAGQMEDFVAELLASVKPPQPFTFESLVKQLTTRAHLRGLWIICRLPQPVDPDGNHF